MSIRARILSTALASALAAGVCAETVLALPLDRSTRLSHDPVVAADDAVVVVAWAGIVEGRSAIVSARRDGSAWSVSSVVDGLDAGECSDPAVAVDGGEPAFAWVRGEGGRESLLFRSGGSDPEIVAASRVGIESPSLAIAASGEPVVAWVEGGAGRFAVVAAVRGEQGWTSTPLSIGAESYDIAPRAFGDAPTVYWYSLRGQDFALRAARRSGTDWQAVDPGALGLLPANRLPVIHELPGSAGAVWIEPIGGGEVLWAFDPRRESDGAFAVRPGGGQTEPDAVGAADAVVYAWREETARGAAVAVLHGQKSWRIASVPHAIQPRVAVSGAGIHLVFASDEIEGGTGLVYWALLGERGS